MLGLGRFLSSLRDMYKEVNPATLTGAVDVIVVQQSDGTYVCSPFYVRFGKMGVVTSREKVVDITINDEPVNLHMRLSQLGDAFFVEDNGEEREVPFSSKNAWSSTYNWAAESRKANASTSNAQAAGLLAAEETRYRLLAESRFRELYGNISLSLCNQSDFASLTDEQFKSGEVTFDQFNSSPDLILTQDPVIKWNGRYFKYNVGLPILLSAMLYQTPLSENSINLLMEKYNNSNTTSDQHVNRAGSSESPVFVDHLQLPNNINNSSNAPNDVKNVPTVSTVPLANPGVNTGTASSYGVSSWFSWRRASSTEPAGLNDKEALDNKASNSPPYSSDEQLNSPPLSEELNEDMDRDSLSPTQKYDRGALSDSEIDFSYKRAAPIRYKKTIYLNSSQLKMLKLKPGQANHATFSVTTKYQGTSVCECDIYFWYWHDKIIISDIDGTITKSDVLGHILPIVGWQWEHSNVVELYNRIMDNGYRFIYLTARAIGQSHQTKDYLRSIMQNSKKLPEGPLLLSPTSLFIALHREVIEKKPEVFKMKCLRDVKALFPEDSNPFYAGFGNKATDEFAYRAAGIPSHRIFTINTQGEVRFAEKDLKSSYQHISDLVDHIFPPLPEISKEAMPPVFTLNNGDSESCSTGKLENPSYSFYTKSDHFGFTSPEEFSNYSFWRTCSDAVEVDTTKFPPNADKKTGRRESGLPSRKKK